MLNRLQLINCIVFAVVSSSSISATEDTLFDLELEELLQIKVSTGQLQAVDQNRSPAAVTIISSDQIKLTPAKNLAELLEVYVPGLMLMAHSEGDKIGLRGNIAAENYKLLILVNGKNITNMIYEGVITEIDQWELGDIEKVEVVRGPGSVVYGTGAIAGIINIITKHPDQESSEFTLAYNNDYNSSGFSYQASQQIDDISLYYFASYRDTNGLQNPDYYLPNGSSDTTTRYLGKGPDDIYSPQPYLGDSFDRPQIKAHIDLKYKENFRVFARYAQSGQLHHFRNKVPRLNNNAEVIGTSNNRQVSLRSLIIAPEYDYQIDDRSTFSTAVTYDTQEYLRYDQANLNWPEEHPNNIKDYAFSQNRWLASFIYSRIEEDWNFSAGYEYRNINLSSPWGKSADHIMVREGIYLISDFATSVYTQDLSLRNRPQPGNFIEIGDGLNFHTHTHLLELNYQISDDTTLHYGHRLDYPDITSKLFAPRFSVISNINDGATITITGQRAQRLLPLRAQYLLERSGSDTNNEHETIDSIELSYQRQLSTANAYTARMFYNDIDAVGFDGTDLQLTGTLKLLGIEIETSYKGENFEIVANHSYIKNLDFTLSDELRASASRNNISFSDYLHFTRGDIPIPLTSTGNGINNWSENSTKVVYTHRFLADKLLLQLNAQIYWDYDGSYDEMRMYQSAYDDYDTSSLTATELDSFQQQLQIFNIERESLAREDAYDTQLVTGASLTYSQELVNEEVLEYSIKLQNLFSERKRYYVSTGSSTFYPNRLSFYKEPLIIGLDLRYRY